MALLYSPYIPQLVANAGIRLAFAQASVTNAIAIYSGVRPTVAQLTANWTSYNNTSPNLLWMSTNYTWSIVETPTGGTTCYVSALGATRNPVRSGVASWAMLLSQVPSSVSTTANPPFNATTIAVPTYTRFILCDVTDVSGLGTVRVANTTLSTATPFNIVDAGITVDL